MTAALDAARALAPTIRAAADKAEADRCQPAALIDELCAGDIYAIVQPREYGGLELAWPDALAVIEEVSAADGSAGWCLLKGASSNMLGAYLPAAGADEIWADPRIVVAGNFNPMKGRAVRVGGGYRLSGRWDWGTGSTHSAWIFGGAVVVDDGADGPGTTTGMPPIVTCVLSRQEVEILDTWHTTGMRGTGSHDYTVDDVFVPEARTFGGIFSPARLDRPLYALPLAAQACVPHAAVAIGIARAAIEDLVELAASKVPLFGASVLAERPTVQHAVGEADAAVRAARDFVLRSVDVVWAEIEAGRAPTPEQLRLLILAATHATHTCVRAVDLVFTAGGGSSVHTSSPIQRRFRDIHVAASHFLVNDDQYTKAGQGVLMPEPGAAPVT